MTYDDGKVLIMGGGGNSMASPVPHREWELINLNVSPVISNTITSVPPAPQWRRVGDMAFGRRQLNATLLPDGTVLATGGTSSPGFDEPSGVKRRDVSDAFWESTDFRSRPDVIADGLVNPPASPTKYNNSQFIRYCYRIYLRGEPDASGWSFWLNNLNQDNNYKRLERSFLVSGEYRNRFHQP